jgi:hypothetical protein
MQLRFVDREHTPVYSRESSGFENVWVKNCQITRHDTGLVYRSAWRGFSCLLQFFCRGWREPGKIPILLKSRQ